MVKEKVPAIKRRTTPVKKRSDQVYNKKCGKIDKWYNHLLKERETPVVAREGKEPRKRKELQPLSFYISKIKKPIGK